MSKTLANKAVEFRSLNQWLKEEYGVVEINENTSKEARDQKLAIANYRFDDQAKIPQFLKDFDIEDSGNVVVTRRGGAAAFTDNIDGGKGAVAVNKEIVAKVKAKYQEYRDGVAPSKIDEIDSQILLLDRVMRNFSTQAFKDRVTEMHQIAIGAKNDGTFPFLSVSAYKTFIEAYVALNFSYLSQSERDEILLRGGQLYGYDDSSFTGLKADANMLNGIGGIKVVEGDSYFGGVFLKLGNNPESFARVEKHAKVDAFCFVEGVGRNSKQKKVAPGLKDHFTAILSNGVGFKKLKVVPRFIPSKSEIPETDMIAIEGGGMSRHSYTTQYWWKAKIGDAEVKTKKIIDSKLCVGKDGERDVRNLEIMLMQLPGKNYWIRKKDYGVEEFVKVDESGAIIDDGKVATADIEALQNMKYSYYRTEYNAGALLHWKEKPVGAKSGTAWVPYTVEIECPAGKTMSQFLQEKIVAERMLKIFKPAKIPENGRNENDPASQAKAAKVGGDEDTMWHKYNAILNEGLGAMVPQYSREMAIQHSGNCAELNKFYSLLGAEKNDLVENYLQEMRAILVKGSDADALMKLMREKKEDLIERKKQALQRKENEYKPKALAKAEELAKDDRFLKTAAAKKVFKGVVEKFQSLPKEQKQEIFEKTKITITEKELQQAIKFLALIAVTGGQNVAGTTQKAVYEDQEILSKELVFDQTKSIEEQIDEVAKNITVENVKKFYQRLISKRPLAFYGKSDKNSDRFDAATGSPVYGCKGNENPQEYLLYSELDLSSMLQVGGPTFFVNDGNRYNAGRAGAVNSFEESGYISGIVGVRFEISDGGDALSLLKGAVDIAIKDGEDGKKNLGRIVGVDDKFINGYKAIWQDFYKDENEDSKKTFKAVELNEKALQQRLYISYQKFIADSIANLKDGEQAYIRIVGIGDGVWASIYEKEVRAAIGLAVRKALNDLRPEFRQKIRAIEFSQFKHEDYKKAFGDGAVDGIEILSAQDAPFSKKLGDKYKGCKLCVNYAYDSCAKPGNEFYDGLLTTSGDPAAACCSAITLSQNDQFNDGLLEQIAVIKNDGEVVAVDDKYKLPQLQKLQKKQEMKEIKKGASNNAATDDAASNPVDREKSKKENIQYLLDLYGQEGGESRVLYTLDEKNKNNYYLTFKTKSQLSEYSRDLAGIGVVGGSGSQKHALILKKDETINYQTDDIEEVQKDERWIIILNDENVALMKEKSLEMVKELTEKSDALQKDQDAERQRTEDEEKRLEEVEKARLEDELKLEAEIAKREAEEEKNKLRREQEEKLREEERRVQQGIRDREALRIKAQEELERLRREQVERDKKAREEKERREEAERKKKKRIEEFEKKMQEEKSALRQNAGFILEAVEEAERNPDFAKKLNHFSLNGKINGINSILKKENFSFDENGEMVVNKELARVGKDAKDLYCANFSNIIFDNVEFKNIPFYVNFYCCEFKNIDFSKVPKESLEKAIFNGCSFENCTVPKDFYFKKEQLSMTRTIKDGDGKKRIEVTKTNVADEFMEQSKENDKKDGITLALRRVLPGKSPLKPRAKHVFSANVTKEIFPQP